MLSNNAYSRLYRSFWTGSTGRLIKQHSHVAVVVAVYAMSSPHANMSGCYQLPFDYLCIDTGLTADEALQGLAGCIQAGFCDYDQASQVIWVFEMARYQIGEQLDPNDKRTKGAQKLYESMPECPYLTPFYEKYHHAFHLPVRRVFTSTSLRTTTRTFEAPSKPHPSPFDASKQLAVSSKQLAVSSKPVGNLNPSVKFATSPEPSGVHAKPKKPRQRTNGRSRAARAADAATASGGSCVLPPADDGQTDSTAADDERAADAETVAGIFAYWQKIMKSPRSRLDDKREKSIRKALGMGYTPHELCQAIRGCAKTPHNMGANDRHQVYNGLALILRNADQIDRFIRNDIEPPAPDRRDIEAVSEANGRAWLNGGTDDGNTVDMEH